MGFQNLLVEQENGIGRITINREKVRNALDAATIEELTVAVGELGRDSAVRVIVIAGAGDKAFVAGADIRSMALLSPEAASQFSSLGHALGELIGTVSQIVIAEVNGFALGGGCELALACDFIYASDTAKFGQPEVSLGVIPGFGGTTRLPRRIGLSRALEMVSTGEIVGAEEAMRIGLVNRVFPHAELRTAVTTVATAIAKKAPLAVAAAKRSLRASQDVPLSKNNEIEIAAFGACFATQDQKEGMDAFLAKRSPAFTGL